MHSFERFSDSAKRVVSLAQEEAQRSQHSYIGTEHVAIALLRVDDGGADAVRTGSHP